MQPTLIVNADDFGLSPAVSQGIAVAADHGIVTSASLMVTTPGLATAAALARARPRLSVGLHFNLTYGHPLSPKDQVPTLVGQAGQFSSAAGWAATDVHTELAAQIEAYRRTGLALTHLDAHHFADENDTVLACLLDLARRARVPLRAFRKAEARAAGVPTTDHLLSDVYNGDDGPQRLRTNLSKLQPGVTELICHPGRVDPALRALSPWVQERERELRVFGDVTARQMVAAAGIRLASFAEVR